MAGRDTRHESVDQEPQVQGKTTRPPGGLLISICPPRQVSPSFRNLSLAEGIVLILAGNYRQFKNCQRDYLAGGGRASLRYVAVPQDALGYPPNTETRRIGTWYEKKWNHKVWHELQMRKRMSDVQIKPGGTHA